MRDDDLVREQAAAVVRREREWVESARRATDAQEAMRLRPCADTIAIFKDAATGEAAARTAYDAALVAAAELAAGKGS